MNPWRLTRADTGGVVVAALEVADTAWSRFKGLQFRRGLAPGAGLLLVPCPSIHTFFVRFPIDVLLLDRRGVIVTVRRGVQPWRVVLPVPGSYATLELPAGTCEIEERVTLHLETAGAIPPRSLAFLCPPSPRLTHE